MQKVNFYTPMNGQPIKRLSKPKGKVLSLCMPDYLFTSHCCEYHITPIYRALARSWSAAYLVRSGLPTNKLHEVCYFCSIKYKGQTMVAQRLKSIRGLLQKPLLQAFLSQNPLLYLASPPSLVIHQHCSVSVWHYQTIADSAMSIR